MDSAGSQSLQNINVDITPSPFRRMKGVKRSPIKEKNRCHSAADISDVCSNTNSEMENIVKENVLLKKKLQEMEDIISKLSNELEKIKREKKPTSAGNITDDEARTNNQNTNRFEYLTDEEELDRETNWIVKKTKPNKKRKAVSSPEYDPIIEHSEVQQTTNEKKKTEKRPPPINIVGVNNFSEIKNIMNCVTEQEYKISALNNDVWKINTSNSNAYRNLTMKLNIEKYQWYTYENKNDRPIKVMARGVHPTCATEDIIQDLGNKGFKILDAVNIMKREKASEENGKDTFKKRGLPLFMLTFDRTENIKNIFNITGILSMRVKIEAIKRTSTKIPQCKKCQGYNHTQKYCGREPRCVKCAGKHLTELCKLSKQAPPQCVNCKGQHPASYRGCEVAKHLQKIKDQVRKPPQKQINKDSISTKTTQPTLKEGLTYAQAVKSSGSGNSVRVNASEESVRDSIQAILNSIEEQNKLNKLIFDQLKQLGETPKTRTAIRK